MTVNHYRSFVSTIISVFFIHCFSSNVYAGINEPYQTPLFVTTAIPPLNMLVMGRDHKLYYEAYNDASDLNNDGVIDVGYKGYLDSANGGIDYYGYFNSHVCYTHDGDKFIPTSATITKKCSESWSGDYLNYLTTSRMDALRKVLYGGYRATDSTSETILQGAFIPQDAHTWGKEYLNQSKDGYLITDYTPLTQPATGYRHLFAVVSLQDGGIPQLRTLTNTSLRIWNWVSKERPVAGTTCNNGSSDLTCTSAGPNGNWSIVPAASLSNLSITTWRDTRPTATTTSEMDTLFGSTYSDNTYLCGSGTAPFTSISTSSNFQNPYTVNNCTQDYYHTRVTGILTPPLTGSYSFSVDGDDAVDFLIGNTVVASRYGNNGASNTGGVGTTGTINLTANQTYSFTLRHEENTGNSSFYLYWKTPETKTSTLTDRNIRVSVCTSDTSLQDDTCALYSNGKYKPTGILHDYGATDKMLFGLLSGSYVKNTSGGVLRSKLQSFSKEYNNTTGQFCSKSGSSCTNRVSNGIVYTIDQFRIIDFKYSGYEYGCGWLTTGPITANNTCYMWGNPVAEMMYETMRYFSGATTPTSSYNYTSSSAKDSVSPLSLPKIDTWIPPYKGASNPSGHESCAVPVMTVISDINSSYDYKVPGSYWDNTVTGSNNPSSIKNLNVSKEADAIWEHEGGGTRTIFIGESNGVSDNAPTPKQVSNLSTVRGLSPEEPSKQGTYYSAAIAKFGAENPIGGDKKLMTYAIALASPLPTIKFPVGSNTITVVPFAKSVGGSSIDPNGSFQPTDQIVDFYVETIANTDSSCATPSPSTNKDCNSSLNGGRPYAKFRINYEDVEQGADHDMDAISLYELLVTQEGLLTINMTSEYAAGGIDQHMGYIISGTTKDGIYLEVKDQGSSNVAYKLDTPTGYWAGECKSGNCPTLSQLTSSRIFTPSNLGSANSLQAPLWYAAKYGVPDRDTSSITETPSNYFLVTNALTLKDQLSKAFNEISQTNNSITAPAASPDGLSTTDTDYSVYTTSYDINTWSGNLIKTKLNLASNTSNQIWTTANQLPSAASRTIKFG